MNTFRKANVAFLAGTLIVSTVSYLFWKTTCSDGSCSYELIIGVLSPIEMGGYILAGFFAFFLILPTHYFESWLKKIFSWAFPLAVLLVAVTRDTGEILSFSRAQAAQILGVILAVVTGFFILHHFLKSRKGQNATKVL